MASLMTEDIVPPMIWTVKVYGMDLPAIGKSITPPTTYANARDSIIAFLKSLKGENLNFFTTYNPNPKKNSEIEFIEKSDIDTKTIPADEKSAKNHLYMIIIDKDNCRLYEIIIRKEIKREEDEEDEGDHFPEDHWDNYDYDRYDLWCDSCNTGPAFCNCKRRDDD